MTQSLREAIIASLQSHGPSATWHLQARGLATADQLRNELRKMQVDGLVKQHAYTSVNNLVWQLAAVEQAGESPEERSEHSPCLPESGCQMQTADKPKPNQQEASREELELVSDEALGKAWGHANFGDYTRRQVLRLAVLKCASGYSQGHTSKQIAYDCGLIDDHYQLTAIGRAYLWQAFRAGEAF